MITSDGKLVRAIQDDCMNYKPIKTRPKKVSSIKLPIIFECENEETRKGDHPGCGYCTNRMRPRA